jgi:hypothetical protein
MSRNDITGDEIKSKVSSKEFEDNYDKIFRNKEVQGKAVKVTLQELEDVTTGKITNKEFYDLIVQRGQDEDITS